MKKLLQVVEICANKTRIPMEKDVVSFSCYVIVSPPVPCVSYLPGWADGCVSASFVAVCANWLAGWF